MIKKIRKYVVSINKVAYINMLVCFGDMVFAKNAFTTIDVTARLFILALSFLAGQWLGSHADELKKCKVSKYQRVFFIFLCLYASFALVGNACFLYPLTMKVTLKHFATYLLTLLWMTPIVGWLSYKFTIHRGNAENKGRLPVNIIIICTTILTVTTAIYVIALNPCVGTYDTVYTMKLAVTNGVRGMQDYQPPFYVLCLEGILKIWESPYAIVITQLLIFVYVYWRGINLLWKKGLTRKGIILCTLFVSFSVNIQLFLVTIWKDIPYSLTMLWLVVVLAYLQSGYDNLYIYAELVIALVCVFFFRQNGIVPFILTCIIVPFVIKRAKVWISVLIALGLVLIIKFPVYDSLDIQRDNGGMTYVGLGLDVAGVYYNGGRLSEEAMDFVIEMTQDIETYEYTPYQLKNISTDIQISMKEFISLYMDTLLHNPKLVIRGILCRTDGIWGIFNGVGGQVLGASIVGSSEETDESWLQYFPGRRENVLTKKIYSIVAYAIWMNITGMFMGRVGVWTFLLFVAMFALICKGQCKQLMMIVPCIGQIISLVLAAGWPDYRYMIPIEFMSIFILVFVWLQKNNEKEANIHDSDI